MDWFIVRNKEDVATLLDRVEFHDWYVAGFSYDPLAQSEGDNLLSSGNTAMCCAPNATVVYHFPQQKLSQGIRFHCQGVRRGNV